MGRRRRSPTSARSRASSITSPPRLPPVPPLTRGLPRLPDPNRSLGLNGGSDEGSADLHDVPAIDSGEGEMRSDDTLRWPDVADGSQIHNHSSLLSPAPPSPLEAQRRHRLPPAISEPDLRESPVDGHEAPPPDVGPTYEGLDSNANYGSVLNPLGFSLTTSVGLVGNEGQTRHVLEADAANHDSLEHDNGRNRSPYRGIAHPLYQQDDDARGDNALIAQLANDFDSISESEMALPQHRVNQEDVLYDGSLADTAQLDSETIDVEVVPFLPSCDSQHAFDQLDEMPFEAAMPAGGAGPKPFHPRTIPTFPVTTSVSPSGSFSPRATATAVASDSTGVQETTTKPPRGPSSAPVAASDVAPYHPSVHPPFVSNGSQGPGFPGIYASLGRSRSGSQASTPTGSQSALLGQPFRMPSALELDGALSSHPQHQHRTIKAVPQSRDSTAVVHALRTLQDKVAALDGEKKAAEQRAAQLEAYLSEAQQMLYLQRTSEMKAPRSPGGGRSAAGDARSHSQRSPSPSPARLHKNVAGHDRDPDDYARSVESAFAAPTAAAVAAAPNDNHTYQRDINNLVLDKIHIENNLKSTQAKVDLLERQLEHSRFMAEMIQSQRDEAMSGLQTTRRELLELQQRYEEESNPHAAELPLSQRAQPRSPRASSPRQSGETLPASVDHATMTRPAMTGASTSPLRPAAATPLSRVRKIPDVRLVDRAVQAEDDGDAAGSEALPESVRDLAGPGRVHKKHPHKQYTPAALRPAATQLFPAPPTEPTEPTERAHRPSTRPATPPPPPRDGRRASPSRPSSPSEPEPTELSNDAVSESFLDPDEIASLKREITRTRVPRATAGAHAARPRLALNGADDRKRELSARMTAWTASLDDPNQAHRTHRRLPSDDRPRDRLDLSHAPRRAAPPTAASTARRHVHPPTEAMPPEVAGLTEADLERPLPFITSGRGGKSYSVTANFQKVLGLLKAHHRARCPSCVQAARSPSHQHQHPHDLHHPPALSPYPAASRAGKAGPQGRPYSGDTQDHLTHDDASYASRESCYSYAEDGHKSPATRSTHAARHITRDAPSRPVATSAPKPRAFAHTRSSTMNSLDHLDPALFTRNGAVPRVVAALREELLALTDQYVALEAKDQRRATERRASRHGRSSSDRRDGTRRPVGSSLVAQDVRDHQLAEQLRCIVALILIKKEQIALLLDMALTRDGEKTPTVEKSRDDEEEAGRGRRRHRAEPAAAMAPPAHRRPHGYPLHTLDAAEVSPKHRTLVHGHVARPPPRTRPRSRSRSFGPTSSMSLLKTSMHAQSILHEAVL